MQEIKDFFASADIVDLLVSGAINLVIAAVIFFVGKWIARLVQKALEKLLRARNIDEVLVDFLGNIVYALVLIGNTTFLDAGTSTAGAARYLTPIFPFVGVFVLTLVFKYLIATQSPRSVRITAIVIAGLILGMYAGRAYQY